MQRQCAREREALCFCTYMGPTVEWGLGNSAPGERHRTLLPVHCRRSTCPPEAKKMKLKLLPVLQQLWGPTREMRAASVASAVPLVALLLLAWQPCTTNAARVDSATFAKISKAVRDGRNKDTLDSVDDVDTEALRLARVAQMKARCVGEHREAILPPSARVAQPPSGTIPCAP